MNKKQFILVYFVFVSINSLFGQTIWNTKKDKITIPFELSNNLIVVDVKINNVDLSMLLDTGSSMNVLFRFPENDSISFFDTRKVKIGKIGIGNYIEAYVSKKNKLQINEFGDNDFEVLLITDQNIELVNKLGIPINGIIGYSFFKDYLVEINYETQKIILHKNKNILQKRRVKKYSKESFELISEKPYLNIVTNFDGKINTVKLLFDTGLGDGLWLFENSTIKCSKEYFEDFLGKGLIGNITGKRSRIEKISFSKYSFKEALVSYPDTTSLNKLDIVEGRNGSIGGEIIKRFNWYIDYQSNLMYFTKNRFYDNEFHYNMSGIEIQHSGHEWVKETIQSTETYKNVNAKEFITNNLGNSYNYKFELKPVFEILTIRKNSPAERIGLKPKDKLVSLNGKKAQNYTIQKITDLFQEEDGKTITIEVDREGVILKFKFKLEKIL
jgi:hypothetical protein